MHLFIAKPAPKRGCRRERASRHGGRRGSFHGWRCEVRFHGALLFDGLPQEASNTCLVSTGEAVALAAVVDVATAQIAERKRAEHVSRASFRSNAAPARVHSRHSSTVNGMMPAEREMERRGRWWLAGKSLRQPRSQGRRQVYPKSAAAIGRFIHTKVAPTIRHARESLFASLRRRAKPTAAQPHTHTKRAPHTDDHGRILIERFLCDRRCERPRCWPFHG